MHKKEAFHTRTPTITCDDVCCGYPIPGPQSPSASEVMARDYFVRPRTWRDILENGSFDYIVIGSGFTSLAFIDRILKINPMAKILLLERGEYWLPDHFQNLPLPFKYTLGGPSETFPWSLSAETFDTPHVKFVHGSCPFFGGRSTFWSAWSPSPSPLVMRDFPQYMIETSMKPDFFPRAKELLRVTPANKIQDGIFDKLQHQLDEHLTRKLKKRIISADYIEAAQLAVGNRSSNLRFNKFSTPGPLLSLYEAQQMAVSEGKGSPLLLVDKCVVQQLRHSPGKLDTVTAIETSRGILPARDAKVILCMGAIPATTLLLNSFPEYVPLAGTRFAGHFLSHITGRVHKSHFNEQFDKLQIGALYLAGRDIAEVDRQYHIQMTAITTPNAEKDAVDAARECPDYAASATYHQLLGSEDYVLLVCATLGELDETNKNNWVRKNHDDDCTVNVDLQVVPNKNDYRLWDTMDEATFQAIEAVADENEGGRGPVEYWHEKKGWTKTRPTKAERRIPGIVHETSTLWMGYDVNNSVVGTDYRPHGLQNVYVTGGALFPTAGSWNPTLTMCGFAQDLAERLERYVTQPT